MFDFDVVTVIPIVEPPTFDFAQSHPHRKMVGGADGFLATVFPYASGVFKMETENAAFCRRDPCMENDNPPLPCSNSGLYLPIFLSG